MIRTAMTWTLALVLLLPASARAQQDPQLIGEGAQVYAANCARCHNARSSTERTDAEWIPIVMHMRARANLTKEQAEAVLAYLQATNLPEGTAAGGGGDAARQALGGPSVVMPEALGDLLAGRALEAAAGRPDRREDTGGD